MKTIVCAEAYRESVRLVCPECAYILQNENGVVIRLVIHFSCPGINDVIQLLRQEGSHCPTCGTYFERVCITESDKKAEILVNEINTHIYHHGCVPETVTFR